MNEQINGKNFVFKIKRREIKLSERSKYMKKKLRRRERKMKQ